MLRLSAVRALAAALLLLVAAGCGGSDTTSTLTTDTTSAADAIAEIEQIKTMLGDAVAQVRDGNAEAAEQTVGDAYLEHYEHVEGPLGERDHDLMEKLEEAISTDLRNEIKAGKSADEIDSMVQTIDADLDRALEILRS